MTPTPAEPKKKPMATWVLSINQALNILTRFAFRAEMPAPSMNIETSCRMKLSPKVRRNPPATAIIMHTPTTFFGPILSPSVPMGMLMKTAVSMGMRSSIEKPASSIENIGMIWTARAET